MLSICRVFARPYYKYICTFLRQAARKKDVKFMKIIATDCIENYPDRFTCPMSVHKTQIHRHVMTGVCAHTNITFVHEHMHTRHVPRNCPTLILYHEGKLQKQFVGIADFGGKKMVADDLEFVLAQLGVCETEIETNPRITETIKVSACRIRT